jgi:PBP1b-binding outer membrane lipoprotein LpoB
MSIGRAFAAAILAMTAAACGDSTAPQQTTASAPAAAPAPSTPAASSDLPPLPKVPFPAARPMPIVESVFRFAAEHPDVLSKMPCFCGCENRGHRHNDDCFVSARDDRGRVTAWEPHGIG